MEITTFTVYFLLLEAATGGALYKKVFLKVSQNSQKRPVLKSPF